MAYGFTGGVRDLDGHRAFVIIGPADVCAIDLARGRVLWSRHGLGRPVAASKSRLLLLDREHEKFVFRFVEVNTAAEIGVISDFGMPDWGDISGIGFDTVSIEAQKTTDPDVVRVSWCVRRPYRGGAAPSVQVQVEASAERSGTVVVDLEMASMISKEPLPSAESAADLSGDETSTVQRELGPYAIPAPEVLAVERIGDRLFSLKTHRSASGATRIALEARDALDGTQLWEVPLAERSAAESSPTPPRPSMPPARLKP